MRLARKKAPGILIFLADRAAQSPPSLKDWRALEYFHSQWVTEYKVHGEPLQNEGLTPP